QLPPLGRGDPGGERDKGMNGQRANDVACGAGWQRWLGAGTLAILALSFGHAAPQGQEKKLPEGTAAQKRASVNNLKQLALALISYADANRGQLPASAHMDPAVRAKLRNPRWQAAELARLMEKLKGKVGPPC